MNQPKTRERPEKKARQRKADVRNLRPLLALVPFAWTYKNTVIGAAAFLLGAAATSLFLPVAVRYTVDGVFVQGATDQLNNYFLMLTGVSILMATFSALRFYFVIWLGERVVTDLRLAVFSRLSMLSADFYDRSISGEMVSRIAADATQIKSAFGASASIALRNLLTFTGAIIMMVITSPKLSAFILILIPFIVLPLVAVGRWLQRKSRLAQDALAEANSYASEHISAFRTVQTLAIEETIVERFASRLTKTFNLTISAVQLRAWLTAVIITTIFAGITFILWLGAQDVLDGTMSAGQIGQFVLFTVFAAGSLSELAQVWGEVAQTAGAAERLAELLKMEPSVRSPEKPDDLPIPVYGRVTFDGVSFFYPTRPETKVLDGVSFRINAGERVAIVGPSGAGKSTIISLIMRLYDLQGGEIRFSGKPINKLDLTQFRNFIAYVPQEPVIFATSVRENILIGRPDAGDQAIFEAAKAANADEFISKLPNGYETHVGERGVTLSGGQKQRLIVARAILRDAPLLLLDEATSALDAQSEKLVQEALDHLMEGRTTITVAHRLATVKNADKILVIDDGKIVETGTHPQLLAKKGLYAKLAAMQFRDPDMRS